MMEPKSKRSFSAAIADCIIEKRAVLFAGAGLSACSGLPIWEPLLKKCIDAAEEFPDSNVGWIREYAKGNDSLMVAEMLQRSLRPYRMHSVLSRVLNEHKFAKPSAIHHALASISWGQILTTNYDTLLEDCRGLKDPVFTWQEATEFMEAMRRNQPLILKLHGSIDEKKSLILSRSEFGRIQHAASSLRACISSMLLLKSFVFIGYSLRDPDVQHLLERNKYIAGDAFGPHYVAVPRHEVVPEYSAFLKEKCGVEVVSIESRTLSGELDWSTYQNNLLGFIHQIEGDVIARQGTKTIPFPELPRLSRKHSVERLLKEAIATSGADRGDVCIQASESSSLLERIASFPAGGGFPNDILPNQVIGTVFLNRRQEDWIKLDDVNDAVAYFAEHGYPRASYRPGVPGILSELAVPIYSGGHRCGVLNLESFELSRFTDGHVKYAIAVAEHIGWILSEVARRNHTVNQFEQFFGDLGIKWLTDFVLKRRAVEISELEFALYQLDYVRAQLIGHSIGREPLEHDFEGKSLAASVLLGGRPVMFEDAADAGAKGFLDPKGLEYYDISGPIAAFPVRLDGITIAVLVTWCGNKSKVGRDKRWQRFRIASERVLRICKLLAVGDKDQRAKSFLNGMDVAADLFSKENLQDARTMQESGDWFRFVGTYLSLLIDRGAFTRVRLWIRESASSGEHTQFTVVWAGSHPDALVPGKPASSYHGTTTSTKSPFTALTFDRAVHDPYSRRQHRSVFGEVDEQCAALDKNPDSEWAVAPLVKGGHVWGFISAEVDYWNEEKGELGSVGRLTAFNHFALDVIAHTIRSFHPESLNGLFKKQRPARAGA